MRRSRPKVIACWSATLLALALCACASRTKPPSPIPQPASTPVPVAPAEPSPPATPPSERAEPTTVVLDSGEETAAQPRSLLEASRLAKERQRTAGQPIAVITDENLGEYASRGKLTVARPASKPDPEEPAEEGTAPTASGEDGRAKDETYWRTTARSLREQWRAAVDTVVELEARAEALRHQFYSQEDVYIRDTRVKPAWDRVLDRLEEARRESESGRGELTDFLDEGRRAGALPGWLREGIELEPEEQRTLDDDLPEAEAVEPVTIDD